ncbi:MAG: DUF5050 domain-containing protein [Marinoscillum sp.]
MTLFLRIIAEAQSGVQIGSFQGLADVGNPTIAGIAQYSEPNQQYILKASGSNIWFGEDSFSMVWRKMNDDFIVQTKIAFEGEGHEAHRKTGIMLRSTLYESAPMVACTIHGDGLTSLQFRRTEGADVEEIKLDISGPDVLQLEKRGNTYIMSVARFGDVYQLAEVTDLDLGNDLYSGLFVCSHSNEYAEEVTFSNTRIFNTAPDDLVQYQTYLPSLLEVLDVVSGNRSVLASSESSWQAPNWTTDGETLIYNSNGLLYSFDLNSRESTVLETGIAIKNNNDHILSFDGQQIGISHHSKEQNGNSLIYTMPITGGEPKLITEKGPSYLHGWSPDNQFLIYTAQRDGDYDIYKIPAQGGKEKRLTKTRGLDDGSEYSPDGKYIYFCSTRTGTMQLWRMDANGKNQIQLTHDALNDWFPHVSPDGKWLVFISFPEDIAPDEHPFYERVYIRIMPTESGEIKTIGYLYGGQGSLNVPSWSPDSKSIAFISNGIFEYAQQ